MTVPYVHSNYERIEGDNYQTIDPRCVQALVESWEIRGTVVDCCAPNGSGIVTDLAARGYWATGLSNYIEPYGCDWIITNPPYNRRVVDDIVEYAVHKVREEEIYGAAFLMRANWDFAACRKYVFSPPYYRGQIRMRFRPWWSEERTAQPIHNYVWHIWQPGSGEPIVRYWP